jgi:Tol biopolymer transport system component
VSAWSPDGQLLSFTETTPTTRADIGVLRLSDRKAQPFLRTPFNERNSRFSPDGRWLAYTSDESGRDEIYVQPYPGPGGKWPISTEGATGDSRWSPNGRELFYPSGNRMMVVDVTTQPAFSAGKPRVLFELPFRSLSYDVSPDGERFLMMKLVEQEQAAQPPITVVLNWTAGLQK